MDAKKCDRCGYYYDPFPFKVKALVDNHPFGEQKKDLCPDCHDKLLRFLKGEKMEGERHGT